jgi:hypothetical protein
MTAEGKVNASKVQVGDRILIKVTHDDWGNEYLRASSTKTGEGVTVARVFGKSYVSGSDRRPGLYTIQTSAGPFTARPIQTMILAPEDAAGIKRALAEAKAEDAIRTADEQSNVATGSIPAPTREISEGRRRHGQVKASRDARRHAHKLQLRLAGI